MIVKHNTRLMNRKAKMLEEAVGKLAEIRTRMSTTFEELKSGYDGDIDSSLLYQNADFDIQDLQEIENSLVQYIEVLTKASLDHDKIVTDYNDRQRRKIENGPQIQQSSSYQG